MQAKIPDKNKKADLCYAVTDDGLELAVIDITQPAFEVSLDESELNAQLQKFVRDLQDPDKVPAFLRKLVFGWMRRRSILMRGLMDSDGTFLSGMNTYLFKLGPDNLTSNYFSEIDRRMAGSAAGIFMRLRLQDITHLLAEALLPILNARPKAAFHLINIGGGPAIDSLNTLLVIRKGHPHLLDGRQTFIHILDLNTSGPNFGERALRSLQAENAPLHGLTINFEHIQYNWSNPQALHRHLTSMDRQSICAVSSEGALFEYGSDDDIDGNLQALYEVTPTDTSVAGSVTRADDLGRMANRGSGAALQFRGLEAFSALARHSGWMVEKTIDRPLSHDVLMKKVYKEGS